VAPGGWTPGIGRAPLLRRGLRFVSDVLIVSGVLVICDVVITLTWQEPISSLYAGLKQRALTDELAHASRQRYASDPRSIALAARAMRRRAKPGDPIGRIKIARMKISFAVVEGTDTASLSKGPGHYRDTSWPGLPGTVAIAGHRTTYLAPFHKLGLVKPGDPIVLEMPYGRFVYRAVLRKIVPPKAYRYVTGSVGYDRLALTACHPLYSARQRIVVFARLISRGAPPNRGGAGSL
jgi:sortase A